MREGREEGVWVAAKFCNGRTRGGLSAVTDDTWREMAREKVGLVACMRDVKCLFQNAYLTKAKRRTAHARTAL